jgi:two-component system, LytTR family, sensor kinase
MLFSGGKKIIKYFLLFFAIGTAIGTMNTAIVATTMLAERESFSIVFQAIGEFTGAFSFVILLPIMLYVFRRYPISGNNYIMPLIKYLLAYIPVGLLHILFMYLSRQWINDLAGWGKYDYGDLTYRIMMEYIKMSTGMLVAGLIYNLMISFKEKEKEKVRRAQLEEQLTKTRLDVLKNQLNPHFLFNTLNMISSAMYNDVKTADKMISNLSSMLRATLQTSSKNEYTIKEELKLLNLYIDIMKARFNDKLTIIISTDEKSLIAAVPHFLLQPLVENSIKYGMENLSGTKVNISSRVNSDRLIIIIKDNGPGIKEDYYTVLKKGFGISNTVERLEKIFNKDFKFSWVNLNEGLALTIDIPFKTIGNNG